MLVSLCDGKYIFPVGLAIYNSPEKIFKAHFYPFVWNLLHLEHMF
ncbi:hypothetical protein M472_09710 [Sphingobacterium paucimobilis HER1398]|uniref:Uncharacterized protein n=1 Tax=Sphingobacterium paucimobilis HER1398 TaxID=1346330 RepID=U2HBE6_9SPHI|nr:hypothetical protein M472_09710 [Sphingobacterium paucimobilis HER1398]